MPSLPNTRQCPVSTRPEVGGAASCFPDPTFCPASLPHCGGWRRGDSDPRRSDMTFRRPSDETCSRTFPLAVQGGWAGNPVLWEPLGAGGGWRFPRCLSQSPRRAPEVEHRCTSGRDHETRPASLALSQNKLPKPVPGGGAKGSCSKQKHTAACPQAVGWRRGPQGACPGDSLAEQTAAVLTPHSRAGGGLGSTETLGLLQRYCSEPG